MDGAQRHLLHHGRRNTQTMSNDAEGLVEPLHLELHRRKTGAKTQHYELPLGSSEGKNQTADVSDERQVSEKESESRQEEDLGKSRVRGGKRSAPK